MEQLHCVQDSQGNPEDSKEYKAAVARVRQAVSVQKAVGFMDASRPAKYATDSNGLCVFACTASRHQNTIWHAGQLLSSNKP